MLLVQPLQIPTIFMFTGYTEAFRWEGIQTTLTPYRFACILIAVKSSSLVNGLVKYCSEPTIRPRALSNKPSLLDSMITGVFLNSELFLMSAQVW